MVYHFTERVDIAPTFHHAFGSYPEPLEEVILEHSPLAQVGRMPDVPYLVIHGDRDLSVNKEAHSDRFVAAMRAAGRQIEYLEIPGMGHGTNVPPVFHRRTAEFIDRYLP